MMGQHYKVTSTEDHRRLGKSGTPVYDDEEDDEIIGFVDFISDLNTVIYLFEPREIDFDAEILTATVEPTVWQDRLNEIVLGDDAMHAFWTQVFGEHNDEFETQPPTGRMLS